MPYRKGMYQGRKNMNAALTEAQVRVIKRELEKGIPASHLARTYLVSGETIRRIGRGETWGWLDAGITGEPPIPEMAETDEIAKKAEESERRFKERFGDSIGKGPKGE